jgi:N-methylhydantoinase A/oxoprolinase/acetone carboxylase beta subunit
MTTFLGIDTGGTYTDAVLFDKDRGVLASAKALTTKFDLAVGIRNAIEAVLPPSSANPGISLVSLSTTLATNALVEGHGTPICLLLLGYPEDSLNLAGLGKALGRDPVVFLDGGHTITGTEQAPLDLRAAEQAILKHAAHAEAFAISGYFGVLNPAHELRVRELVRQLTGLPVTCGHELTSNLHAPRRALTAALNARLIPYIEQLIASMRQILDEKGIRAPLMVVKGDGSLMDARVAVERPVETILSGPAASVVGARYLCAEADVLVVDMGGTTTDIALLQDGRPALSQEGATVGGWRTMVEAIAVHTSGLGGDSEVTFDVDDGMQVGPQRIVPLSLLAHQYPEVLPILEQHAARESLYGFDGQFALRQRHLDPATGAGVAGGKDLDSAMADIWEKLADGPMPLDKLFLDRSRTFRRSRALAGLVERGYTVMSGFTPSDACHVLGYQDSWSSPAAQLGAVIGARRRAHVLRQPQGTPEEFSRQVFQQVLLQLGRATVEASLSQLYDISLKTPSGSDGSRIWRELFLDQALGKEGEASALLDVSLHLRLPLAAVGAPVATYFPGLAERLHSRLVIPEHAGIANAIGAVVGSVTYTARAILRPMDICLLPLQGDEGIRVHLPTGIHDLTGLEEAAAYAEAETRRLALEGAERAGARDIHIHVERQDHIARGRDGKEVLLDSDIVASAAGRPRLAEELISPETGL